MKMSVKEYLAENVAYHMGGSYTGHSYPCGVWSQPTAGNPWPKYQNKGWAMLVKHGVIPKTFVLISIGVEDG